MKKTLLLAALIGTTLSSQAVNYSFTPSDNDLDDLDHRDAVTWGITWSIPTGYHITGATLTITDIYDWKVENDKLFIHLLDDPYTGIRTYVDNDADNVISDYFSGQGILLGTWTDPVGGVNNGFDLTFNFTAAQLATLNSYIIDANGTRADFGFGFDPDCHYYNSGVCFQITTAPNTVPDGGSTLALFGVSLLGLFGVAQRGQRVRPAKS